MLLINFTKLIKVYLGLIIPIILLNTTQFLAQTESVEKILREDGSIITGTNGAYNAEGYTLVTDDNNKPKLIKTEELYKPKANTNITWSTLGSGNMGVLRKNNYTSIVRAIAVIGNDVFMGGNFDLADSLTVSNIVKYNITTNKFSSLGTGVNGQVYAFAVIGTNLYVGGSFTSAGGINAYYIAKWDGNNWSALTGNLNGNVYALATDGTDLYVGGTFTSAGSTTLNYVGKYIIASNTWSELNNGVQIGVNSTVYALACQGSNLYVGGQFTAAGGSSHNYIAKWDGSNWINMNNGFNYIVYALAANETAVYAGGSFTQANGDYPNYNYIAKWNGTSWQKLGSDYSNGTNYPVKSITLNGNDIYVGGNFTVAGNSTVNKIAKWDGANWSALEQGITNGESVNALVINNSKLYVGGEFSRSTNFTTYNISKWDLTNNAWSPIQDNANKGVSGKVYSIAIKDDNIYLGGNFTYAGDIITNNIAKYNYTTKTWSALGSGTNNTIYALAIWGNDLYAGGSFTTAGGNSANYIAKWNGSNWSPLSLQVNNTVYTLFVFNNNLYVGGDFTYAGSTQVNRIAKWDGNSWSQFGSGMDQRVYAIVVDNNFVYAGGAFNNAGGNSINYLAKWADNSWTTLGSNPTGSVFALALNGSDLYAGGEFSSIGGVNAKSIARWNGSQWFGLGDGIPYGAVYSIVTYGSDLYCGGSFYNYGGNTVNYVGKWNGYEWKNLVENSINGTDYTVRCLAVNPTIGKIIVGGEFINAGNHAAYYVAAFSDSENPLPVQLSSFFADVVNNAVNLYWSTDTEINNLRFDVQRKTEHTDWITIASIDGKGNSNVKNDYFYTDLNNLYGTIYYRLKQVDLDGNFTYTNSISVNKSANYSYSLSQNYPNPFNPVTNINYTVAKDGLVKIKVYDVLGNEVCELLNQIKAAGSYTLQFNASNLPSGVYFYKLETDNFIDTKKMLLIK